jgi:hypothetical protein
MTTKTEDEKERFAELKIRLMTGMYGLPVETAELVTELIFNREQSIRAEYESKISEARKVLENKEPCLVMELVIKEAIERLK